MVGTKYRFYLHTNQNCCGRCANLSVDSGNLEHPPPSITFFDKNNKEHEFASATFIPFKLD